MSISLVSISLSMKYFDQATPATNVITKKVCVDISHFNVFSYRACAISQKSLI